MIVSSAEAMILAGGRATRWNPLAASLPKALLPMGSSNMLLILLEQLTSAGIGKIYLSLGYMRDVLKAYAASLNHAFVECLEEDMPLGTAGPLSLLPNSSAPLILLNCDILSDIDFEALLHVHADAESDLTVVAVPVATELPYGELTVTDGRVTAWNERVSLNRMVAGGVYALSPRVRELVPRHHQLDMPDLMRTVIDVGGAVQAHIHHGMWFDVGEPSSYATALQQFTERPANAPRG